MSVINRDDVLVVPPLLNGLSALVRADE